MNNKIKAKITIDKKTQILPNTGFYFTAAEEKECNKVFCFYAFDDASKTQVIAYIPKELVLAEIKENNILNREQEQ